MKRYNVESKCPKCGNDDILSKFFEKGMFVYYNGHHQHMKYSFIERHCSRCHYEWGEKPLDEETNDA